LLGWPVLTWFVPRSFYHQKNAAAIPGACAIF
jgi:hypothetical protein